MSNIEKLEAYHAALMDAWSLSEGKGGSDILWSMATKVFTQIEDAKLERYEQWIDDLTDLPPGSTAEWEEAIRQDRRRQ